MPSKRKQGKKWNSLILKFGWRRSQGLVRLLILLLISRWFFLKGSDAQLRCRTALVQRTGYWCEDAEEVPVRTTA